MCLGIVRLQPDCLLNMSCSFRELPLLFEDAAEVEKGLRIIGLDAQGLLVAGDGLIGLSLLTQRGAEVVVGDDEIGLQAQGLLVACNRLINLPLFAEGRAMLEQVAGSFGLERKDS